MPYRWKISIRKQKSSKKFYKKGQAADGSLTFGGLIEQ